MGLNLCSDLQNNTFDIKDAGLKNTFLKRLEV